MRKSVPAARPPLPDFMPVPRKYRHDGWTPDRHKAFIQTLADIGSVRRRPRAQINTSNANAFGLYPVPGGGQATMASANIGTIRRWRRRESHRVESSAPRCAIGPPAPPHIYEVPRRSARRTDSPPCP